MRNDVLKERRRSRARTGYAVIRSSSPSEAPHVDAVSPSEARFRALAEATAQVIWTADASGEIRDPAQRWSALTGLPAQGYPYGGWLARVHPDDRAAGDDVWWAGVAAQQPFHFEQRVLAADNTERTYLVRAVPVFDEHGKLREWVGADIDVTPQRTAAQLLERKAARAQFLAELRADLDRTPNPVDQLEHAARAIAQFLHVGQVAFWAVDPQTRETTLEAMYCQDDDARVDRLPRRPFAPEQERELSAGRSVVIDDLARTVSGLPGSRSDNAFLARTYMAVPFLDQGVWTRVLTIADAEPRAWAAPEVELIRLAGERVWLAVANAGLVAHLQASEARFRELAEAMPQVVWVARPDGTVEYYNQRVLEFDGAEKSEDGTWDWQPIVAEDDLARTVDAWSHSATTGDPYEIEHRIVHKNGEVRWRLSRAEPIRDDQGRIVRWYGTATDIHDLKLAQIELDRRRREFESLVENAPDIVARFDSGLRYVYVNPSIERLTGIPPSAFLGRTNDELGFPAEFARAWDARAREVRDSGKETFVEHAFPAPSGTRYFRSRLVPELGPDGSVTTVLSVTYDITDRVEAERDREHILDVLVHDLKNPLASLKLQTQVYRRQIDRRGIPDAATLLEQFASLEHLGARTNDIVEEITQYARVASGQSVTLDRTPLDLGMLVREEVAAQQRLSPGHTFVVRIDERPVSGVWDAHRLRRMVTNLLGNAVKYSPDGGKIEITVAGPESAAELRIEDHGIGIPDADLPHVFDFRHRAANVQTIAGLGLGLAGCRHIVEQHGGEISISSRLGHGTAVTVRLPYGSS